MQGSCQAREPRAVHCGRRTVPAPVVRMLWKTRLGPGAGRSRGSFHFGSPCRPLSSDPCFRGSRWGEIGAGARDEAGCFHGSPEKGGGGAEPGDATSLRPNGTEGEPAWERREEKKVLGVETGLCEVLKAGREPGKRETRASAVSACSELSIGCEFLPGVSQQTYISRSQEESVKKSGRSIIILQ